MSSLGIAVASGTLKGVFAHGVLSGLEEAGVRADVYGGLSSSTLSTGLAAVGAARDVGVHYWIDAATWTQELDGDMSVVALRTIEEYGPAIANSVFENDTAPALGVFVSHVRTAEATEITQGSEARRLGRRLLMRLLRGDTSWVDEHLEGHMFWTDGHGDHHLTPANFADVTYGSTRMMHAWLYPAWVDGEAYVDGSYLKLIPDDEVRDRVDGPLVAIGNEPGRVLTSFSGEAVLDDGRTISVAPDFQLAEIGVDFQSATPDGMARAYAHGLEKGLWVASELVNRGERA